MRLLHRDHVTGAIDLTQDLHSDIPPYAILSHRWGPDEVTLQELSDGTGLSKAGYHKIRFCGEQAWRDGLSYFWVDTCCIDKKNAVELQAAIISMFRWYHDANRCYVYLDDVSCPTAQCAERSEAPLKKRRKHNTDTAVSTTPSWHSVFRKSLWFTRGWTLQELLAPASVEFFSREHTFLGNKSSLERSICDITRIPVEALRNCPLSDFSVSERFSWMDRRETTLEEDKAYAMLGIFYIQMPLLYGEGYATASGRLRREVSQATKLPPMPVAEGAAFDSRAEEHNARCYPNTRVDLLHQIASWAVDHDGKAIFWLNGIAGIGKSTISRTVAQHLHEHGLLGASFFFKRGEAERGHAGRLFTTIAAQIAAKLPRVAQQIQTAIDTDPNVCNKALQQQFKELILHTLNNVQNPQTLVIVIDALDECDKDVDIRAIIHLLSQAKTIPYVRLRTFLTSRPELPIRLGFQKVQSGYQNLVLHQIPQQIIMNDLRVFFNLELTRICEEYNATSFEDAQLPLDWPSQHIDTLVRKAYPLFIVAATTCRFLDPARFNPADQLQKLLDYQAAAHASDQLGSTYLPVLNQLISDQSDVNKQHLLNRFRDIVGTVILLAEPLSARALSRILHISLPDIQNQLKLLHSVLDIPSTTDAPVRTFHLSFRNFLSDTSRQDTHEFWINEKLNHKKLVAWCIQLLSTNNTLKKDICNLCSPGVSLPEVDREAMNRCLPPEVQYACLYWVHHLELGDSFLQDEDQAHKFLQTHFLHWLEALCLIGRIHDSISMIQVLRERCQPGTCTENFLRDANRFIRNCISTITLHPLQLYCSAISFAPQKSVIRQVFQKEMSAWIVKAPAVADTWNACTQTLEGHDDDVVSIAISPDSLWLASASRDGFIKIWDIALGACTQTFEGHSSSIASIAISPDSRWLASRSRDGFIKIWDVVIGACTQTIEFDDHWIEPIGVPPNGHWLISGFRRGIIKVWDAATGVCIQTLNGHDGHSCLSPDGRSLLSGSFDGIVKIWDMATSSCKMAIETNHEICSIAISSDGHWFASGMANGTIQIWDLATGTLQNAFGPDDNSGLGNEQIAISPDSRWLATRYNNFLTGSDDIIKIWDVATGVCTQTLKGHNDLIISIAISPNGRWLASASRDRTIKIWDIAIGVYEEPLESRDIISITVSPDSCWLASGSSDGTLEIWDVATATCSQILPGLHALIAISSDSCLLASSSGDITTRAIKIWDVASGACIQTLKDHDDLICSIVLSSNNRWLASICSDRTIKIWDVTTGACAQTFKATLTPFRCNVNTISMTISPDIRWLALGLGHNLGMDGFIEIWDVATRTCKHRLRADREIWSIAISPDCHWLASTSRTIQIWDVKSESLYGARDNIYTVSISPDSRRLTSGSDGGTIKIWDIATGACTRKLCIGTPPYPNTLITFDSDLCFHTAIGSISLDPAAHLNAPASQTSEAIPPTRRVSRLYYQGYKIDATLKWITWNDQKVMWLPSEYRPLKSAIIDTTIAIACASGRILVFKFSTNSSAV
ncbi:WD40-repeat-containing domain protein [Xylaria flabelliformis]|nr:WD40-repeat-containing domain protein [Xylaria flabelliformis]